jgi:hypothetical protein
MFRKDLPATLTSYDILKTVAVVLMVVDHIGAYYMPENLWLRLIGRLCVPMWFFLIGYARSRDISWQLWLGAAIVIASDFITGRYIFPLNILVTILMVRIVIDLYMKGTMKNTLLFWTGALVLTCLIVPSMTLMQYGTLGLLLAVFGWLIRNTEEQDPRQFTRIFPYMVFLHHRTVTSIAVGVAAIFAGSGPVIVLRYRACDAGATFLPPGRIHKRSRRDQSAASIHGTTYAFNLCRPSVADQGRGPVAIPGKFQFRGVGLVPAATVGTVLDTRWLQ